MISRRFFLLGTAATAVAASVPLATITAQTPVAEMAVGDTQAAAFLKNVTAKWDNMTQYYDWQTVQRMLIPEISGTTHQYRADWNNKIEYKESEQKLVEDEYFSYEKIEGSDKLALVARYKINGQWYTLQLCHTNSNLENVPVKEMDDANVEKAVAYLNDTKGGMCPWKARPMRNGDWETPWLESKSEIDEKIRKEIATALEEQKNLAKDFANAIANRV